MHARHTFFIGATALRPIALATVSPKPPASLPRPEVTQVWIDFDGTITRKDVLDELILAFAADDSWKEIETRWQTGKIGSLECLTGEFDLLRVNKEKLASFLNTVPVDAGALALFNLMREQNVPFTILSDGIESFIRAILSRVGAGDIPIRANRIEHENDRLRLVTPHRVETCESRAAHCKCASACSLGSPSRRTIYIGDGRSDLCPARKADVIFAKGALARYLTTEGIPFHLFDSLADVASTMQTAWAGEVERR